jgi:ABC-type branched-subunit amino acid transport system substrate-binding protein
MRSARFDRSGRVPTAALVALLTLGLLAIGAGAQTTTTSSKTTPSTTAPSKSGATTTTGTAAGAVRGVTDDTIKVGGLVTSALYGDAAVGAKARFGRANAAGGVNGRKIDFSGVTDDGGTPDSNKAAVATLVGSDTFAVVPAVASDMAGAGDLVNAQMPYFGWGLSSDFCGNGFGFGYSGCIASGALTTNIWGLTVKQGFASPNPLGNTAAVLTDNSPAGQYALKQVQSGLKAAGLKVTFAQANLPVPPGGDYGALLKDALGSNGGKAPRAIFVVGSYSNVMGVQQALRDGAYLGTFTNLVQYDPNLVAQASGASVFVQTGTTESAANTPSMKQLVDDVQAVAPDQAINQSVIAGYLSADLFLAAVQKAGRNLTVGKLLTAANKNFTYQLQGVAGPTKFPGAHASPTPCGSLARSDGVAFQIVTAYTCGKVVKVTG